MITLQFFNGESKTGEKGSKHSHWYASATSGFDASGESARVDARRVTCS